MVFMRNIVNKTIISISADRFFCKNMPYLRHIPLRFGQNIVYFRYFTIFPLSSVMMSSANFRIFLSCSIIRMVSHLSKNSLMTLINLTMSSACNHTVGSSRKYIVCPLYDFSRCLTSFSLWLSPQESVCAGCPILRYHNPISTMSCSSSRM